MSIQKSKQSLVVLAVFSLAAGLQGCAVVSATAGAAISVAGAAASTAIKVTGSVASAAVDAVAGSDDVIDD